MRPITKEAFLEFSGNLYCYYLLIKIFGYTHNLLTLMVIRLIKKICFRFNSRRKFLVKPRMATTKSVSKRSFSFVSEGRIEDLKHIQLKKKSEAKVNWTVTAYVEWREERLRTFRYDPGIYYADITKLESLEKVNLAHALCHFIPEVTKVKGDGPYPGNTLYQMVVALQKYLNVNKLYWQNRGY